MARAFLQALSQLIMFLQPLSDHSLSNPGQTAAGSEEEPIPVAPRSSTPIPAGWERLGPPAALSLPGGRPGPLVLEPARHPPLPGEPATVAALLLQQLHQSREIERQLRQLLAEITQAASTPAPDAGKGGYGTEAGRR